MSFADEMLHRDDEDSREYVVRITPVLRKAFAEITNPAEKMSACETFAYALNVPFSVAWVFLTSTKPVVWSEGEGYAMLGVER